MKHVFEKIRLTISPNYYEIIFDGVKDIIYDENINKIKIAIKMVNTTAS